MGRIVGDTTASVDGMLERPSVELGLRRRRDDLSPDLGMRARGAPRSGPCAHGRIRPDRRDG